MSSLCKYSSTDLSRFHCQVFMTPLVFLERLNLLTNFGDLCMCYLDRVALLSSIKKKMKQERKKVARDCFKRFVLHNFLNNILLGVLYLQLVTSLCGAWPMRAQQSSVSGVGHLAWWKALCRKLDASSGKKTQICSLVCTFLALHMHPIYLNHFTATNQNRCSILCDQRTRLSLVYMCTWLFRPVTCPWLLHVTDILFLTDLKERFTAWKH